jgi:hypothetical protein
MTTAIVAAEDDAGLKLVAGIRSSRIPATQPVFRIMRWPKTGEAVSCRAARENAIHLDKGKWYLKSLD